MQITQIRWNSTDGWSRTGENADQADRIDLVLVFADTGYFQTSACYQELRALFPNAEILGCSSAGNLLGTVLSDGDIVGTAIRFCKGGVCLATVDAGAHHDTRTLAARLMEQLPQEELKHVFILADGLLVDGSDLAAHLNGFGVPVTGGLAGDGTHFGKTWVMANAPACNSRVAALGLYGDLNIKSGCFSGFQEFGAERKITKSSGNVVHEIDGKPALPLYKKYLGELAAELPASGLRFPLSVKAGKGEKGVIRSLLGIDETMQSLTFAGHMPQGSLCRFMKTSLDDLVDSAGTAAGDARPEQPDASGLCIVVSCVGRRLVLGQLTEDEIEVVQEQVGERTVLTGLYSYGELAPVSSMEQCQLHNQTMTLTTICD